MKNVRIFYLNFFRVRIKFSVYLNRHVFVMRPTADLEHDVHSTNLAMP